MVDYKTFCNMHQVPNDINIQSWKKSKLFKSRIFSENPFQFSGRLNFIAFLNYPEYIILHKLYIHIVLKQNKDEGRFSAMFFIESLQWVRSTNLLWSYLKILSQSLEYSWDNKYLDIALHS